MDHVRKTIFLENDEMTTRLGRRIAPLLGSGDVILLKGQIGSGKTHFARALIKARLEPSGITDDVPSPTFTLVQTYDDGSTEIWHADLYRLGNAAEIDELGLLDAFETAICLVEWPEILDTDAPKDALTIEFNTTDNGQSRSATLSYASSRWNSIVEPLS